ncbi:MAG: hypothetical protein LBO04_04340 [Spirochaetaceae bacterium]|jgi:hypothetical protein|nr:hypothetical protein [Spirochaetaceae bacterium]
MKKLVLLSVLAAAAAGGAFGQAWYNSYAPGIEGSKIFVNGGIGVGILPYKMSLPPISFSAEYVLAKAKIPLSVGAYFGITGYNEKLTAYSSYKGTLAGFGAKASYHFNFLQNLDPYVSLTLGWLVYSQEVKTTVSGYGMSADKTVTTENDLSTFFYGFNLGTRYFFTENIGAYVELGYSAVSVLSAGLSLKF